MTIVGSLSLLVVMIALAAIPSSSVALVIVRSATLGVRHGIACALGIVAGDLVFVALAITGLVAVAETMGTFFVVLRFVAAAYLIWLGLGLIRHDGEAGGSRNFHIKRAGSLSMSFVAGLALTLGDLKAILFYAALFPAFVDISSLAAFDAGVIAVITLVAVGGVKIAYAVAAHAIVAASEGLPFRGPIRVAAGALMIGAGGYLIVKGL